MEYKISQYARLNNVTVRTVWNWIRSGRVDAEKTKHGWRVKTSPVYSPDKYAVYARVSSSENKDNLERQKQRLLDYCSAKGYIVEMVVTEIGSGLNDKRTKLEKILLDKSITHIVVEHKDRLTRFGINYIEKMLNLDNRYLVVINNADSDRDDLMGDFVAIITSFTARLYGQRRNKRKTEKLIKELAHDEN